MGYSYDSIPTYQGELYEACVNSTMELLRFDGSMTSGWYGWDNSGTEYLHITPIGGAYEGSVFVSGGQVTNAETGQPAIYEMPPTGFPFHDVPSMVAYYGKVVNEMFVDWTSLPEPSAFSGPIAQARTAAHRLAIADKDNIGPGVAPLGRNTVLDHVQTIDTKIGNMSGLAINTFYDEWCVQCPKSLAAQDSVACLLYATLVGEQKVWQKARQSVADIAGKGVEAAKGATGGGDEIGLDVILSVAGAVALVAAPFTDGASLIALNGVGVLAQTAADFVPEQEDEKKGLEAYDPVSVLANMSSALDALNTQIRNEENGILKALNRMDKFVTSTPDSFGVKTPELVYDDDKGHYLNVVKADLDWVANTLMAETGQEYAAASNALDAAAGSGPWSRPGSIGLGATGPYSDWVGLQSAVTTYVSRLYQQNEQSRAALAIVARDFGRTDDQIETDLRAQTAKVQAAATR